MKRSFWINAMTQNEQLNRRHLLQQCGGGIGGVSAASLLNTDGNLAAAYELSTDSPHFPAKAKRVIHLFMNGGPFGADVFDPKPSLLKFEGQKPVGADLLTERPTGGLLASPFQFRNHGEKASPNNFTRTIRITTGKQRQILRTGPIGESRSFLWARPSPFDER